MERRCNTSAYVFHAIDSSLRGNFVRKSGGYSRSLGMCIPLDLERENQAKYRLVLIFCCINSSSLEREFSRQRTYRDVSERKDAILHKFFAILNLFLFSARFGLIYYVGGVIRATHQTLRNVFAISPDSVTLTVIIVQWDCLFTNSFVRSFLGDEPCQFQILKTGARNIEVS